MVAMDSILVWANTASTLGRAASHEVPKITLPSEAVVAYQVDTTSRKDFAVRDQGVRQSSTKTSQASWSPG